MAKRVLMAAATVLALGVFGVSAASAGAATPCENQTLTGEIKGDVSAGPGCQLGEVAGTPAIVKGNVMVNPGGSLLTDGSSITGNIQSNRAKFIELHVNISVGSVFVGGNVQLSGTTERVLMGGVPPASPRGPHIDGNLEIMNGSLVNCPAGSDLCSGCGGHSAVFLSGIGNTEVGGNFQVMNNTGSLGECPYRFALNHVGGNFQVGNNHVCGTGGDDMVEISVNDVLGNLEVMNNTSNFGVGFGNTVKGNTQVQNNTQPC